MNLFEALMIIAFGVAWPTSIYKSYVARNNSGKSIWFLLIVFAGYIFGIIHKIFYTYDWVLIFYVINLLMVMTDRMLYFRNAKIMKAA